MGDPVLKKTRVTVAYTASDGYRFEFGVKSGDGTDAPAQNALLEAIDELARLLALFGFKEQAKARVDEAFERVAKFRAGATQ